MANTILWVYIALLIVGGLMGYLKAGSKVSLITSVIFAIVLALIASGTVGSPMIATVVLLGLLLVFVVRYAKTKKFMPAGLMLILTLVVLLLRFFAERSV